MRVLVAGAGSIGRRHAANAAEAPGIEAAVFDTDAGAAETCGMQLQIRYFSTMDRALAWGPDAAIIAVPTHVHLPVARMLVEAGAHVLVEKPIAGSHEGVPEFLDFAEARRRKVFVACNMRFHPAIKAVREALPLIGRPLAARAHYGNFLPDMRPGADYRGLYCSSKAKGGGVILDGIHEIDYAVWLFGTVGEVVCQSGKLSSLELDVEDYAELSLLHGCGFRTQIHLDYLRRCKRRGLEVIGELGSLVWLSEGRNPENCRVRLHTIEGGWTHLMDDGALDAGSMYRELLNAFLLALEDDEGGLLDGRDAFHELLVALAALRSSKEKTAVRVT